MWRIYYEDGSRFDSSEGRPQDSPNKGVMAVRQHWRCDSGHHASSPPLKPERSTFGGDSLSANWYVYRFDVEEWLPVDREGVLFQAAEHGPIVARQGAMMPHDAWEKSWLAIANDPDFS